MSLGLLKWFYDSVQMNSTKRCGKSQHAVLSTLCFLYNEMSKEAIAKSKRIGDRCHPSMETLEKMTGLGKRQIQSALNALRKKNLITWDRGNSKKSNAYYINSEILPKDQREAFPELPGLIPKIGTQKKRKQRQTDKLKEYIAKLPTYDAAEDWFFDSANAEADENGNILQSRYVDFDILSALKLIGVEPDDEVMDMSRKAYFINQRWLNSSSFLDWTYQAVRKRLDLGYTISNVRSYYLQCLQNLINNKSISDRQIEKMQELRLRKFHLI